MRTFFISNLELTTLKDFDYDAVFPEAEVVSIAGNISENTDIVRKFLKKLQTYYNTIVYVFGNLEFRTNDDIYEKIDEIERYASLNSINRKFKKEHFMPLFPVHLRSNVYDKRVHFNDIWIDGNDTIFDNKYYNIPNFDIEFMNQEVNMQYFNDNPNMNDIANDSAFPDTSIFVSRYIPTAKNFNNLPWKFKYDSYFDTFDGSKIFDVLPNNAIIHYGSLKWKDKRTVKYKDKQFTFICNSYISPWPTYDPKDYVIEV